MVGQFPELRLPREPYESCRELKLKIFSNKRFELVLPEHKGDFLWFIEKKKTSLAGDTPQQILADRC